MIQNQVQYDTVKEILLERAAEQRRDRPRIKTRQWYEIVSQTAHDRAYIDFSYEEFYDIFKNEVVGGSFSDRKFSIEEEGFLGCTKNFPYAIIHIDFMSKPKKNAV